MPKGTPSITAESTKGDIDFSVEYQILFNAGATALSEAGIPPLNTSTPCIPDTIDWQSLYKLAQQHGMEPLLIRYLKQTVPERLPPEFATKIDNRQAAIQAENLTMVGELRPLLEAFQANEIPILVYKGPVAATRAYGNIGLRTYTDFDLLVPPDKEQAAQAVLKERGYQHQTTNGPVLQKVFCRPGQLPTIDLHTSVVPEFFPFRLDFDKLYGRRTVVDVAALEVPTVCSSDAFLIHSVHGSKHHWFRLEWVLATAIISHRVDDIEQAFASAERLGCERMVLLGLELARRLFEAPPPESVSGKLGAQTKDMAIVESMSKEIMEWILHREWANQNVKTTHIADFKLRSRLLSDPSDKAVFWTKALTKPRSEDYRWVNLPPTFSPLYRVIRPVRLLWDYRQTLLNA